MVHLLNNATGGVKSVTVLSSDKGVAFQFLPNSDGNVVTSGGSSGNANCSNGEITKITITSEEDFQLRSDLDTAPDEMVTVEWTHGVGANKQPQLAWAGQRVILEWDWSSVDGTCLWGDGEVFTGHVQLVSPLFLEARAHDFQMDEDPVLRALGTQGAKHRGGTHGVRYQKGVGAFEKRVGW